MWPSVWLRRSFSANHIKFLQIIRKRSMRELIYIAEIVSLSNKVNDTYADICNKKHKLYYYYNRLQSQRLSYKHILSWFYVYIYASHMHDNHIMKCDKQDIIYITSIDVCRASKCCQYYNIISYGAYITRMEVNIWWRTVNEYFSKVSNKQHPYIWI